MCSMYMPEGMQRWKVCVCVCDIVCVYVTLCVYVTVCVDWWISILD